MASIGTPQYITPEKAAQYAAQAGFSNQIVSGTKYTQIQIITAIASAESGLDVHAFNPSDPNGGSFGILQINGFWFGHGISQQGALNALQSFQFAYTAISHHGTNFNDWSTFKSGVYKNKVLNLPGQGSTPLATLPADGWWTFPRIDNLGLPDSYGGFPKPDSNIQVPDNYHIETILSGTVSGINAPGGNVDAWGASVTIRLDNPLNDLATHIAFLHLANVTVRMGQHVNVGDRIGYNGGNFAAGSQKVPLGVALYHGEYYGHDGWQYMTVQNLTGKGKLNIVPLLDAAKSGSLSTFVPNWSASGAGGNNASPFSFASQPFGLSTFLQQSSQVTSKVAGAITPGTDVAVVLEVIDLVMKVINPFQIFINTDVTGNDPSTLINDPNPLDWFGEFAYALSFDITALTIRGLLLFIGAYMCFKVVNKTIDLTGTINRGIQAGTDVAKLAALA